MTSMSVAAVGTWGWGFGNPLVLKDDSAGGRAVSLLGVW